MKLEKQIKNNNLTIAIEGQVDTTTAPTLEKETLEVMPKVKDITLNFKKVDYVSSAGLRVLLSLYKKQKERNNNFVIEEVNSDVKTVLEMTGFTEFLTIK